jgi:hypothetical protein
MAPIARLPLAGRSVTQLLYNRDMPKRKIIGECALCLNERELRRSHFLSAGAYRRLRSATGTIKDPILITAKFSMATSQQLADYLLCAECEQRLNRGGENYALSQMNDKGNFPLHDRLKVSPRMDFTLGEEIYSGLAIGVDTEKLAYFALSVIWRSAVHTWRGPNGHIARSVELGEYQEPIRRYLMGEDAFPDVSVIVNVCTDWHSQGMVYAPTPRLNVPGRAVAFLMCGLHFQVFLGASHTPDVRELCCVSSSRKPIFSRDIRDNSVHSYAVLMATAKTVGALGDAEDLNPASR